MSYRDSVFHFFQPASNSPMIRPFRGILHLLIKRPLLAKRYLCFMVVAMVFGINNEVLSVAPRCVLHWLPGLQMGNAKRKEVAVLPEPLRGPGPRDALLHVGLARPSLSEPPPALL